MEKKYGKRRIGYRERGEGRKERDRVRQRARERKKDIRISARTVSAVRNGQLANIPPICFWKSPPVNPDAVADPLYSS